MMKKALSMLGIASLGAFAYGADICSLSLPAWEATTIYRRAEIMLQTKAEAAKSEESADDYLHIQTLISLSSPLTPEESKELEKDVTDILLKHPEWGKIKAPATVRQSAATIERGQGQQNKLEETLNKYNDQKKSVVLPDLKETANEPAANKNSRDSKELLADGDFPAGQFYEIKNLDSIPYDKEFKSTYYFIDQLIVDYPINDSYLCHLDESLGNTISNLLFSEKRQFLVKFPFPTPYLKKESTLFFTLTNPLTIKGKVKYKDTAGDTITKYICKYQGKSLPSLNRNNEI
ncbi:MAG: hypothetical protein WCR55_07090 [Lentisphaerota bacterium]